MKHVVQGIFLSLILGSMAWAEGVNQMHCRNLDFSKVAAQGQWEWYEPTQKPMKAVALVVHGLNNTASIMKPLIQVLNQQGIGALNVSLTGYTGNKEDLRNITADQWLKDVFAANCVLQSKAQNLPQYYVGYSLGALIGETLLSSDLQEKFEFQKALLFSPALRVHDRSYWVRAFAFLGHRTSIISFAPRAYVAYRTTPNAAYKALFDLIHIYSENLKTDAPSVNIPTMAFVDPDDELVSSQYLEEMIGVFNLDHWQLTEIKKDSTAQTWFHHVTIDAPGVGEHTWQHMLEKIKVFLN